jgi:uncharacterized membrane protein YqiK
MEMQNLILIGLASGALLIIVLGAFAMLARFYRQVAQGQALIINTMKSEPTVTFTGAVVFPIVHRAEIMDISVKTVEIDRRGKEGLICQDNIRADINVAFFVRVNKTRDDVLKVAQSIGCVRASDANTLRELFAAKFSEGLKTVGKHFNFEDLYTKRDEFKDRIIQVIGTDLNGFVLDDCAIDYLEQTPLESLDSNNIMDADGIRKITELTVAQHIRTNDWQQKERMEIGSQNLTADEALFRFEQRRAEAEAKKNKDISVAQSQQENDAARVASEERKKTLVIQHRNEEEVLVTDQAKLRGVAVAEKNREREVAIETERVEKARQLEILAREREVELTRIEKEKLVEVQRKEIADVIRSRIAVDKTVAQEEENIKDLRTISGAKRDREAKTIGAEAEAQQALVKQVKAAEAAEQVAKHQAKVKLTLAEADQEAADKQARAKIRVAEGVTAETAAEGLAKVRVREADAIATEKQGLVEARVTLEKMQAQAAGEEKQGLARVRVKEADAEAVQKQGLAQALIAKESRLAEAVGDEQKGLAAVRVKEADAEAVQKQGLAQALIARETRLAEAAGDEQKGLAAARVKEAEAAAIEKRGTAEASATREKLLAEAQGLAEKASSMKALDDPSRAHEEFRLRIEKERTVDLEAIRQRTLMVESQAKVLAEAFSHAKINIVGGDGQFFQRFVQAVTLGQSVDGALEQGETLRSLFREYTSGERSLPEDVKQVLSRPAIDTKSVQNLTLSAMLASLMTGTEGPARKKLEELLGRAKELGIDNLASR